MNAITDEIVHVARLFELACLGARAEYAKLTWSVPNDEEGIDGGWAVMVQDARGKWHTRSETYEGSEM